MFRLLVRALARQQPEQAPVTGARLTRIGPGAWAADRELVYARGARLPLRMVVLEHEPGALTLYAPVAMDAQTIEALAGLGTVRCIVAANRFHTLFVGRAMDVYPEAELLVPMDDAGLGQRFPRRTRRLIDGMRLGSGTEVRSVRWREGLQELVAYHDAAELLVVCDLLLNLHSASGIQKQLLALNGVWRRPAQSRLQKWLLLKDRASLNAFYFWAMSKPFSQISMAHGQLITRDAREHFYQLFGRSVGA